MKELFIFDLDGLTLDTEKIYFKSWFNTARYYNIPMNEKDIEETIGMSGKMEEAHFARFTDIPFDELMARRDVYFWEIVERDGADLKPGVQAYLSELKKKGFKTAMVSSSYHKRAQHLLELAGLDHAFDYGVFGDMVKNPKPDPEPYRLLETMTDIPPSKWIVYEDSYNGIKAANNAGVDVVWIKDTVDLSGSDLDYLGAYDSFIDYMGLN